MKHRGVAQLVLLAAVSYGAGFVGLRDMRACDWAKHQGHETRLHTMVTMVTMLAMVTMVTMVTMIYLLNSMGRLLGDTKCINMDQHGDA